MTGTTLRPGGGRDRVRTLPRGPGRRPCPDAPLDGMTSRSIECTRYYFASRRGRLRGTRGHVVGAPANRFRSSGRSRSPAREDTGRGGCGGASDSGARTSGALGSSGGGRGLRDRADDADGGRGRAADGAPAGGGRVGTASASCKNPTFATIQPAVDAALPGGTIYVCAGSYTGPVTIRKKLRLLGAQYGRDARIEARPTTAQESVITSPTAPGSPSAPSTA